MDDDNCTGVWRENMMLRGITKTAKKMAATESFCQERNLIWSWYLPGETAF